ncbi:MAG TPA: patatin-like phospholipase family protein [Streptosporangiaceae bacterium]|nr:patatin-like phospholipase family protein [Streptosporangiaceae bacterium]
MTQRGLVLGGGGITGIAWQLGMLAGLAAQGIELTNADLVVGTSAGSIVGAQLTSGASVADLYQAQLGPADGDISARMGSNARIRYLLALCSRDGLRARVRIGRMALASPELVESRRREVIMSRLPSQDWPAQKLLITVVDADSGECAVFSSGDGVSLVDAVAASCAVPGVWPPLLINGKRWMDGGMRSASNADLAGECDRIVVLAPVARGFRNVMPAATRLCKAMTRAGRSVALLTPDRAALAAIGPNLLDSARRADAAQAGYAQAANVAVRVADVWSG